MSQPPRPLFVYGTLRDPALLAGVLGREVAPADLKAATAPGHRAAFYPDRLYPGIATSPSGGSLPGLLVNSLTEADLAALDSFEGDEYERRTVAVETEGRTNEAEVYWPLALMDGAREWTFEQWRKDYAVAIVSGGEGPDVLRERLVALRPRAGRPGGERPMIVPDVLQSSLGPITIQPVNHASMVFRFGTEVLYVDPVGGAARYEGLPPPTAILLTHEHGDHFDVATLTGLIGDRNIPMLANRTAYEGMPPALQAMAGVLANGDEGTFAGAGVLAVPAYNTTEGKTKYHPRGNHNGYTLSIGDRRIHISGDTEDTPELLALRNIDVLFLPMNQPYTMTPAQAARVVNTVKPAIAYPMHYKGTDPAELSLLVPADNSDVRIRDWYDGE